MFRESKQIVFCVNYFLMIWNCKFFIHVLSVALKKIQLFFFVPLTCICVGMHIHTIPIFISLMVVEINILQNSTWNSKIWDGFDWQIETVYRIKRMYNFVQVHIRCIRIGLSECVCGYAYQPGDAGRPLSRHEWMEIPL